MNRSRIYSGYASAGNRRLYVRVPDSLRRREANGSATVLIHPLTRSGRSMRPLIRALGDRDVYAPDLPGFGLSDEPQILGLEELSDQLRRWMLASGLISPALVACGSGCQVAIDIAARYPALPERLVLVGPTLAPADHVRARLAWRWLRATARTSPSHAAGLLRDLMDAGPGRTARSVRSALSAPLADRLGLIEAPTLVVRGDHDPFVGDETASLLLDSIPDAREAVLAHAGHGAFSSSRKLAPVLREFLDADPAAAPRANGHPGAANGAGRNGSGRANGHAGGAGGAGGRSNGNGHGELRRVRADAAERRTSAEGTAFIAVPVSPNGDSS